jgi:hypothetical protein
VNDETSEQIVGLSWGECERQLLEDALQEARAQRDKWQQRAELLALVAPKPPEPTQLHGWWPFRRSA